MLSNEEQHIPAFLIMEIFGDGQTGKGDTIMDTWRFVHLTIDESDAGVTFKVDSTSFNHLVVKIVTLTSTFIHTTEDRETTMGLGDVDEFLN